ncbi:hypothetical protein C8J56DRAFT_270466 [Mycena floridula]|nr:hypothetical protein C8J56DRAFT_270466 [Mycena floridula]
MHTPVHKGLSGTAKFRLETSISQPSVPSTPVASEPISGQQTISPWNSQMTVFSTKPRSRVTGPRTSLPGQNRWRLSQTDIGSPGISNGDPLPLDLQQHMPIPIESSLFENAFLQGSSGPVDPSDQDLFALDDATPFIRFPLDSSNLFAGHSEPSHHESATYPRRSSSEKLRQVVTLLSKLDLTPTQFLTLLLGSEVPEFTRYRGQLYAERSDRLFDLLDVIWANRAGRVRLEEWMMRGAAEEVFCDDINRGMESSKKAMLMESNEVTIKYLEDFSINKLIDEVPLPDTWTAVLNTATTGRRAETNTMKSTALGKKIISAQVLHLRSQNAQRLQLALGLFAWGTGASRALIEVMHRCQLVCCFRTISDVMKNIGNESVAAATALVNSKPHLNMPVMTAIVSMVIIPKSLHLQAPKAGLAYQLKFCLGRSPR